MRASFIVTCPVQLISLGGLIISEGKQRKRGGSGRKER